MTTKLGYLNQTNKKKGPENPCVNSCNILRYKRLQAGFV